MNQKTIHNKKADAIALKKIIVPVDFSEPSQKAATYAMRLARVFNAEVTLLYVVEVSVVPNDRSDLAPVFGYSSEERAAAGKQLRDLANLMAGTSPHEIHAEMREGVAAEEIVDAEKALDADLIVIGTHGYTGWKHLCIGSTAEQVVRTAPCPVLTVKEKEHDFI